LARILADFTDFVHGVNVKPQAYDAERPPKGWPFFFEAEKEIVYKIREIR